MARYLGLHHPAFATRDIAATTRFWRDLLGMRLVCTLGEPGNRQYFFHVGGPAHVTFFEWPEVEPVPRHHHGEPLKGPQIFDHLAIAVADEAALWELMGRLDGAGQPVSDMVDHGFLRSIYTHDPNGIPLEFTTQLRQYDVDHHPVMSDREPPATTREGPDPVPGHWPPPDPVPDDARQVVPGEGYDVFHPEAGRRTG